MKQSPSEILSLLESVLPYMEVFMIRGEEPLVGENLKTDLHKIRSAIERLKVESPSEEGKEMTLEQCFNETAKKYGFPKKWDHVVCSYGAHYIDLGDFIKMEKEAAELYAQSKLKQLEKSDQEALAKAWQEGRNAKKFWAKGEDGNYSHVEMPKNPYTKDTTS